MPPGSPESEGKVVVEPGRAIDAREWLKRRFRVCDDLELSTAAGLVFRVIPRCRKSSGQRRARRVSFGPLEQFELALNDF
jgi:hypothetical protein